MKKLGIWSAAAIVMVSVLAVLSTSVIGQGAFVDNKPDGNACLIFAFPNIYFGPAVTVGTPSGNVLFDCNASLIIGPGVGRGTVTRGATGPFGTTCQITETPSGNANATCH